MIDLAFHCVLFVESVRYELRKEYYEILSQIFMRDELRLTNMALGQLMEEIEEKIAYENQKYWQNRFLFGNEYNEFVWDISLNWNTSCIIPKNYLTKNDDFHIHNWLKPLEYERDETIMEPIDEKLPLIKNYTQQQIEECEL